MKPRIVSYHRVKNLGNYESERLEITAEVDDGEDYLEVAEQLRAEVNDLLFPPKPQLPQTNESTLSIF